MEFGHSVQIKKVSVGLFLLFAKWGQWSGLQLMAQQLTCLGSGDIFLDMKNFLSLFSMELNFWKVFSSNFIFYRNVSLKINYYAFMLI